MKSDYVDKLPGLSDREKRTIRELGAPSPVALYSMIQAVPEAFSDMLGEGRAAVLKSYLEVIIDPEERERLKSVPRGPLPLGVDVAHEPPSGLRQPPFDIAERNRLYDELQSLKRSGDHSRATLQRVEELEKQLNELLAKAAA